MNEAQYRSLDFEFRKGSSKVYDYSTKCGTLCAQPQIMAKILDGKKLSEELASELKEAIGKLEVKPKLVIIQVGNLPESNTYIKRKIAFATEIGALVEYKKFPEDASDEDLVSEIGKYNGNPSVHGIIVQLPIPKHFDVHKIIESIDPRKDVDGLTAVNTKHLFDNKEAFVPATAKGVISLLEEYKMGLGGKRVVIVGRSSLVGKPVMLVLLNREATVTVCHKDTGNLSEETKRADILITAVGKPESIRTKHVSKNQVVVDIGISVLKNGKIVGDVDFKNVKDKVRAITPVPGGVGPMTVVSLFQNLLKACALQTQ